MKLLHTLGLLLALGVTSASASTLFTYTGNFYNSISYNVGTLVPYSEAMRITMSFEFASPLVPNAPFDDSDVSAFSISDGRNTFTSVSSACCENFLQGTINYNPPNSNGPGEVVGWSIVFQDNDFDFGVFSRRRITSTTTGGTSLTFLPGDEALVSLCSDPICSEPDTYGLSPFLGTWTIAETAPVPIPPAIWFLGSAIGAVGLMRRRMA